MSEFIFTQVVEEIRKIVEVEEQFFLSLDKESIVSKFNCQNRSIKQIVGHMIDSATNNLHRIVHLQYNASPLIFPNYSTYGNNDRWIAIQSYQDEDWAVLIQLWKYSHIHLMHVIEHINPDKINNIWLASSEEEVSLKDMVLDYPRHLKLHIKEVHQLYND